MKIISKIKIRKEQLGLTNYNISKLLQLDIKIISSLFNGKKIEPQIAKSITNLLGLDIYGNNILDSNIVIEQRAEEKAKYIIWLVQDTSALENQGIIKNDIKKLIAITKNDFLYGEYRKNLWVS